MGWFSPSICEVLRQCLGLAWASLGSGALPPQGTVSGFAKLHLTDDYLGPEPSALRLLAFKAPRD